MTDENGKVVLRSGRRPATEAEIAAMKAAGWVVTPGGIRLPHDTARCRPA